jgi:hypothetical protein
MSDGGDDDKKRKGGGGGVSFSPFISLVGGKPRLQFKEDEEDSRHNQNNSGTLEASLGYFPDYAAGKGYTPYQPQLHASIEEADDEDGDDAKNDIGEKEEEESTHR